MLLRGHLRSCFASLLCLEPVVAPTKIFPPVLFLLPDGRFFVGVRFRTIRLGLEHWRRGRVSHARGHVYLCGRLSGGGRRHGRRIRRLRSRRNWPGHPLGGRGDLPLVICPDRHLAERFSHRRQGNVLLDAGTLFFRLTSGPLCLLLLLFCRFLSWYSGRE